MSFINAIFWEFMQNVPVLVLFTAALWLWARGRRRDAIVCSAVSAVVGSLLIRFTEPFISGYHEPWSVTLVNIVAFGGLQVLFAAYLNAESRWSHWKTDALCGGLAGVGLALAQGMAANGAPWIGIVLHGLALGLVGALLMSGLRQQKDKPLRTALMNAAGLALFMTLVISAIDYSYLLLLA
ncbi:MAG TPA: hypothetical protein PLH19_06710 [Anaerolineae bacterium]|nr:hypothetical protein [Anaerolineae bacterium]HQH38212.1 hypothetical protein [Anaerolineae bacterium]